MKLVTYSANGKESFGIVAGDGIVDLGRRTKFASLFDVLRASALGEIAKEAGAKPDVALKDVTLLPPVRTPEKIICVGVNYANRNAEYKDNSEEQKYPSLFCRAPGSLVGHGQPIVRPPESPQLDYEGEIVLVVGKAGRRIPRGRALEHVAGLTLCNEGTIRDWVRHAKFNTTQGKNFDASGSIGPFLVTADEFDFSKPFELTTRVNGEVRQHDTTANMIFDFGYLLNYISTFTTLKPGDVIVTGTPTGAGARFDPPRWLVPGDVVEVEVPGIGLLRNTVEDEVVKR
ncbi:MAG: fumarylacetoacetate hydrolase family protein [Bradyrhizobiaceae bacterium]|nr:fumarylacetoacetate hydrolase family protein [Bradyrhizobiaceae bacterium]